MKTVLTDDPAEAAECIRKGGLAAFPTETVFGLGCNVFDDAAIAKIFVAKGRPQDNPLIIHVADPAAIYEVASTISADARALIEAFFPGPLTVVLPKKLEVPDSASGGLSTIGVRMPRSILAREFLSLCATPVAAPSANISGRPSPTTWQAVLEDLDGRIDCILKGEAAEIGLESTVVDCSSPVPVVLRAGAVSLEDLRVILPKLAIVENNFADAPRSPGMKHRHYSPRAEVELIVTAEQIDLPERSGYIGLHDRNENFALVRICDSTAEYAHSVFEFFRECDRAGLNGIFCECVDEAGIGAALMDRLRRAAE